MEKRKVNTKYKNLSDFYNKSQNFLLQINSLQLTKKESVNSMRKIFNRDILNSYYLLRELSKKQKDLLGSKSFELKFSMDSLLKNRINHPEISFEDYKKLDEILNNPDKISLSKTNDYSILLFKKENKYYQAVIKTTKNKEENFMTSFRYLSEKEYNKA